MQIVAEADAFDLAHIQPLEADRRATAQAVGTIDPDGDHGALLLGVVMVGEQAETRDASLQRCFLLRRLEGDAPGDQSLQ